MKPLKVKESKAARVVVLGSLITLFSFMVAFAALGPDNKFHTEKTTVKNDISNVQQSREVIKAQREYLKACKESDDKAGASITKTELRKAKADLKRDKAYLRADKKALANAHMQEMEKTSAALWDDHQELCQSKKLLKKDMRTGNAAALVDDAQLVAQNQRDYDRTLVTLEKQEKAFDEDMALIDEELDKGVLAWFNDPKITRDKKEGENKPLFGKANKDKDANTTDNTALK